MKLVVGLGNPEDKYKNTFHNLGFMAIDNVAKKLGVEFTKQKCRALIAETKIGREKIILAKPQTYMNLSGESVRELISFFKIELSNLMVIYDDFDLYKGNIRIREDGSAGTHNGMRNILQNINSQKFVRVRIGFKPNIEFKIPLIDYVLSGIKEEERPIMEKAIEVAGNAGVAFCKGESIQKIMQDFNGKVN